MMDKLHDIALGIIVGAAVGDALGAPLEFLLPRNRENWVVDMIGGGVLKWKPGETTDDTAMSLAIAEMYIEKKSLPPGNCISKMGGLGEPAP
jgi:ADP-ribosylglycohydrolase